MSEIFDSSINYLYTVDSTNNYATQIIKQGACAEGYVVVASQQTSGRGQMNNSWESEMGKNLLLSIVLMPHFLPIQKQFMLSKIVCIAICETMKFYVDNVKVKWPNDIYIGNKKVAGVLVENAIMGSRIDSSIVGIGLNVNQTVFLGNAPNPISLAMLLNREVNIDEILEKLLFFLKKWYLKLKKGGSKEIDREYNTSMFQLNTKSLYSDSQGQFYGEILGVNKIGQLIIEKEDGTIREYHFKEVSFIV